MSDVLPTDLPEQPYLQALTGVLRRALGAQLVGVYLFGSAAYGAYEAGHSDLDVQAVTTQPPGEVLARALAAHLSHAALPCPARKLEFVLYTRQAAATATRHPQFALNLNTGAGQPEHLSLDPSREAGHWFLLDIAAGRERGRALVGPPPAQVFAAPQRAWVLDALLESLRWHRDHDLLSPNSVANACRGWRWAETGTWDSKRAGVAWAAAQPQAPAGLGLTADAVQARENVHPEQAREVLAFCEMQVRTALERENDSSEGKDSAAG